MGMEHVSSGSDSFQCWRTPRLLGKNLVEEYGLECDIAADENNALCPIFVDEETNGLSLEWTVPIWCNPPYRYTKRWLNKAYEEVDSGRCPLAVFLVPASIGVDWFKVAYSRCFIWVFDERIKFEAPPFETLSEDLQKKLYKIGKDGDPVLKQQPGGGNILIEVHKDPIHTGILGMRSAIDGSIISRVFGEPSAL